MGAELGEFRGHNMQLGSDSVLCPPESGLPAPHRCWMAPQSGATDMAQGLLRGGGVYLNRKNNGFLRNSPFLARYSLESVIPSTTASTPSAAERGSLPTIAE